MTPEDEWLASELQRDRERRAWHKVLKDAGNDIPANHPINFPRYRDWVVLAVVLGFIVYGAFAC